MKTHQCAGTLLVALSLFATQHVTSAAELTFDDISGDIGGAVPLGYGGYWWTNMNYIDSTADFLGSNSGYENGAVSPPYVAYNNSGADASLLTLDDSTFTLVSAYFTGAWRDGLQVTVTGYRPLLPPLVLTFAVDTTAPSLVNFNWANVASLSFHSEGGTPHAGLQGSTNQFVMDNMVTSVPEPSSLVLGIAGVLLLGFTSRRLRR